MNRGIVVNTRALGRRVSGVERYTGELLRCLGGRVRQVRPGKVYPAAAMHAWEQLRMPLQLRKGELLWSPANSGPVSVSNQVLTLHDTSALENPEWFHPVFSRWYRWMLPRLVRRVRQVLTISEYSRRRIIKVFSLPAEKVSVVHPGVNLTQFHPASQEAVYRFRKQNNLDHPYLLFVGTNEPRKNLSLLMQAWQNVQLQLPGVDLVIAGGSAKNFARQKPYPKIDSIRFLGYVPDEHLPELYSGAEAFILPSIDEGFGLTVLEAMACGTAVIASNAGAIPEVVGEAGVLIDPQNQQDLAKAIHTLLSDRNCKLEYRQRGLERAGQFSWEKSANQIYQELEAFL